MKKKRRKERDGLVHLDPDKLDRERLRLGLSKTQVADRADVSRNTVLKAFDGEGIFPKNALAIANALECNDVHVLLPTDVEDEAATEVGEGPVNGEWGIEKQGRVPEICQSRTAIIAKISDRLNCPGATNGVPARHRRHWREVLGLLSTDNPSKPGFRWKPYAHWIFKGQYGSRR